MLRKEKSQRFDIAAHQCLEHGVFLQGTDFLATTIQKGPVIAQERRLEARPPQRPHMLIALRIMYVIGASEIENAASGNSQQLLVLTFVRVKPDVFADAEALHVGVKRQFPIIRIKVERITEEPEELAANGVAWMLKAHSVRHDLFSISIR